jgi:hypothetical protein
MPRHQLSIEKKAIFGHMARLASPAIRDAATVRFIGRRLQR